MMRWFDRHRRLRDQLSAYIDGELDSPAAERLESHLAQCQRCRAELLQLRATVDGLRGLPEVEPPRSFTLTPERVAAPPQRLPATPPLAIGARIAAAGLAAALAAVLVVDLGDIAGNGATQDAAAPQTTMERLMGEGGMEAATGAPLADEAEGVSPAAPGEDDAGAAFMRDSGAAEPPATGPGEAATSAPAPSDGGIDALTAAEIGLAAALGVLVAASLALAFAGRKR